MEIFKLPSTLELKIQNIILIAIWYYNSMLENKLKLLRFQGNIHQELSQANNINNNKYKY